MINIKINFKKLKLKYHNEIKFEFKNKLKITNKI